MKKKEMRGKLNALGNHLMKMEKKRDLLSGAYQISKIKTEPNSLFSKAHGDVVWV